MTDQTKRERKVTTKNRILFVLFLASLIVSTAAVTNTAAQTSPSPSPSPTSSSSTSTNDAPELHGGYEIKSSVELGVRGVDVDGYHTKYRSDFNYNPGFRVFDSSFLLENREDKRGIVDSLLITSSGWGGDPTGSFRLNASKTGIYRFDTNIRSVKYFNFVNNHALGQHNADTDHKFGDFDFTLFPERQGLRFRFGYSYNRRNGIIGINTRPLSDEFQVLGDVDSGADDIRATVEGQLAGFNLSLTQGYRRFNDDTLYFLPTPSAGNNLTNTSVLTRFQRVLPIDGRSNYTAFHAQRAGFNQRVNFTGRLIYATTETNSRYTESLSGRDASNNFIDQDIFNISGSARRTEVRGSAGITFKVTDKFRISDTIDYNRYNNSGELPLRQETVFSRTAAGVARATTFTSSIANRIINYDRWVNTIEGDYQFNNRFGFNIGYRYTTRDVRLDRFDRTLTSAPSATNPTTHEEEFENETHGVVAGFTAKPMRNWTIYGDVEHGETDNAFTRLSNNDFTNYRIRSRWHYGNFSFNASAIARNNNNFSTSTVDLREFVSDIKTRSFTANLDWSPVSRFSLGSGYTYTRLTANTDITVPLATRVPGVSQYFMRDHYFSVDVFAQPHRRVSFYGSYRINKDNGQGDRFSPLPQIIISSYPFTLTMPEAKVSFRLARSLDWNVGYQYIDYTERANTVSLFQISPGAPNQDYRAHLVYTSVRFYFGRRE